MKPDLNNEETIMVPYPERFLVSYANGVTRTYHAQNIGNLRKCLFNIRQRNFKIRRL